MPAAAGFRMAGVAGEPFPATKKLDRNPVSLAVVMAAPGFSIDDRAAHFVSMDVHG